MRQGSMSNHPLGERNTTPEEVQLIEQMVERSNMKKAYSRVMRNKGAAGIDNMPVESLMPYLREKWSEIKEQLVKGQYKPKPVKKVEIPKPDGGKRQLGIPTVLDRLIPQAIYQILSPIFEPTFSENSYGFRPGRSAHQAIQQARGYQTEGRRWVVDMDLAKFFDEVNHDILMSRIAKKVKDKKLLLLIRRYLQAGIMNNGMVSARDKGTPQGGPLSPLLSNIVLDEIDKELERRGHAFCRYADDCNVYVKSEKAGQRVFESISKVRGHLKTIFRSGRGRSLQKIITEELNPVIRSWINYFRLAEVKTFAEELDGWIRRRLRLVLWKQWKKPWTRRKRLINAGLSDERAVMSAFNRRGSWWNSGASHMNDAFRKKFFDRIGLVLMLDELYKFRTINFRNRLGT